MNEERQSPSFSRAGFSFSAKQGKFKVREWSTVREEAFFYPSRVLLFLSLFFVSLFLVSDFADNAFFIIFKPFFY